MRARFRSAAATAAVLVTLLAGAPTASADDPIGGPLLAGSDIVVDRDPGTPAPPGVDAASYVLADLETGEILAGKAAHRRLRPASTLKMLTALALLPRLDLDDEYTATYEDDAQIGSAVGIVEGTTYTIDELFLGLFLASGNDAAHALANAAGGMSKTVRLMREEGERIQALDTTPMNASGLDVDGQLSSAYDLALIGRAGMQLEEFREYAATEHANFPDANRDGTYAISNHNQLLGRYPGAIGIKNGYTSKSGYTYLGAAEQDGRTLIVSLLQGESDVQQEAARLMDWGFEYGDAVDPVGLLVDPIPEEPTAPPTPTTGAASPPAGVDRDGLGVPGGDDLPLSMIVSGLALLVGSAGTVVTVRRVRRRRALRAELVRWATQPRPRPSALYAPVNGRPPGPPPGSPAPPPPGARPIPPLALPAGGSPGPQYADGAPGRPVPTSSRAPAPPPPAAPRAAGPTPRRAAGPTPSRAAGPIPPRASPPAAAPRSPVASRPAAQPGPPPPQPPPSARVPIPPPPPRRSVPPPSPRGATPGPPPPGSPAPPPQPRRTPTEPRRDAPPLPDNRRKGEPPSRYR